MGLGEGKNALVTLASNDADPTADMAVIHHLERDRELSLDSETWGGALLEQEERGWKEREGKGRHLFRTLTVRKGERSEISRQLKDHIVRFPSAPIYGTNRKSEYGIEFRREPTQTLRVLTRPEDSGPVDRLFIFHNGLNESENLRFYYRLADWILAAGAEDENKTRSACVIAPFPGHLTQASFSGQFSQTPLQRYLSDSGELFRQFLRYMVEMRWLLSTVNRELPEKWMVGGEPIHSNQLKATIVKECTSLRKASQKAFEQKPGIDEAAAKALVGEPIRDSTIETTIDALNDVLELPDQGKSMDIHVIGYSLGGFLAQAVFFAWPNLVSSCATICSGGAIRALSPTAFAHPEEWQAVLHTLRPELEESMLRRRIARDGTSIAGMREGRFSYYQRIFDQVFLQEDHASYKARLSEYGTRMLFIGGGEDPIVRPREVLDASPKEGITMLSVANLTHFLGESARSARERGQREFWLPEAGGLIARAAGRAEELHQEEREAAEEQHGRAKEIEKRSKEAEQEGELAQEEERKKRREKQKKPDRPKDRDLESPSFEEALDWVIDGVSSEEPEKKLGRGWLFVCRNGLPAAFLDAEMRRAWASGLRHHDVFVQTYAEGLTHRAAELRAIKVRTTLVLPDRLRDVFVRSSGELIDPHSDAPGYLVTEKQRHSAWTTFLEEWGKQAQWFDPGLISQTLREEIDVGKFSEAVSHWQEVPSDFLKMTQVPDVWIALDEGEPYAREDHDIAAQRLLDRVVKIIEGEKSARREAEEKARNENVAFKPASGPMGYAGKELQKDLDEGKVRIVRVSASELNPRYRGRFESSFQSALLLMAHCAGALLRSRDVPSDAASAVLASSASSER